MKFVTQQREYRINAAKAAAERKLSEALSIPEIANAHAKYVTLRFNATAKNTASEKEVETALNAYKSALKAHGYDECEFEYTPLCPDCNDTGVHGGKVCKCVWSDYIKALKKECKIEEKATFTFKDYNSALIPDENLQDILSSYYKSMLIYSEQIPNSPLKNLVFSGSTGTGKTCLASAVARNAVEHGKSCKYMSAFEFNNEMLSAHTSPIAERASKLHDILTADLVVIDDIGVEPIYKNVTVEYLLLVLEERTRAGLCTIITTNLNEHDLQSKYGDRISSRLLHKKNARFLTFSGNDLRLM